MNELLEDKLFNALKNKTFTEFCDKLIKKHGSKYLYDVYINSIKKYLFDNEELFKQALYDIHPASEKNKEFWLEAIKKPQFFRCYALNVTFECDKGREKLYTLYGKEFVKKTIKDFANKMPKMDKIEFINLEKYLSKEHRNSLKEHQEKIISPEYKTLLNDYIIDPSKISENYDDERKDSCPYCNEKLTKTKVPGVKGEYELCTKDKIIFINKSQTARILDNWTINELFKE